MTSVVIYFILDLTLNKTKENILNCTHCLGSCNIAIKYILGCRSKIFRDCTSFLWCKYGFQQLIDKPTRISKHKASIIDHNYSNTCDVIIETSVPDYTIIDHLPVCLTRFTGECQKTNEHKSITYRSFKHFSKEAFISDIMTTDFNLTEQQCDSCGSLSLFYDLLNSVVSKHTPIKQKRVRYVKQPGWFNEELKILYIIEMVTMKRKIGKIIGKQEIKQLL